MYEFAVTPAVTQIRRAGVIITEVTEGSLAEEMGLAPDDRVVKVNGRAVRDYLDFRFQTAGETELELTVKKADGETWQLEIEREEGEDFGLMFEQIVPRQCANECLFCFCKGNPEDARPSLFVRDEDIRLSFLYGNYTTLSSITADEMKRIVEQRLSPQYVSVHATDLATRAYLLGVDKRRADISDKIKFLLENDIEVHAQVVLCPTINDGEILEKTLRDLAEDHPKIISVAIVPVALTRYNTDTRLTKVTSEFCRKTVKEVEKLQKEFRGTLGTTFAFLGDEIYIKAGLPIPSRRHYGNYPQIEDGVGMIRSFTNAVDKLLKKAESLERKTKTQNPTSKAGDTGCGARNSEFRIPNSELAKGIRNRKRLHGTILTGTMFAPLLSEMVSKINKSLGTKLKVLAVPSVYFGGDVSVAGLLAGQDVTKIKRDIEGDFVIIPSHIIKSDEPILIDGMSFAELKKKIKVPIVPQDLEGFIRMLETGSLDEGEYVYNWQANPRNRAAAAHPTAG